MYKRQHLVEATEVLTGALDEVRATGEVWWEAEVLRLLAEARAAAGAPNEEVAALVDEAVALAELRGQVPLARRARATRLALATAAR